jgi:hypothetical protein
LIFQIDKQELRQNLDALRELLHEKERREQAPHDCAYANAIAERTRSGFWCVSMKTPAIIIHEITIDPTLPEPEDVQRERQLAELRDPEQGYSGAYRSLYLFESLYYYDFLFRTANGQTQWWWLMSDPGDRNGSPASSFGPFATRVSVPARDFLASNNFSHAGSWKVLGRSCDAFSACRSVKAGRY